MHLLYFFKRSLDPLHFLLLPLQLIFARIGCLLEYSLKVYTCLYYWYQGLSLFFELLVTLHIEIKLLKYMTTLVAENGSFYMVALFLLVQIDHKIETKDNEKYFKFSKLP